MNILVVEDDRDIRELVCQSLAQNDFRTVGCRDVQDARQLLAEVNTPGSALGQGQGSPEAQGNRAIP